MVDVDVVVPSAIYDVVKRAADRAVDGGACADYQLTARSSGREAQRIIDGKVPDVWIPDSTMWIDDVNASIDTGRMTTSGQIATSPVIIAVPKALKGDSSIADEPWWLDLFKDDVPMTVSAPKDSTPTAMALAAADSNITEDSQRTPFLRSILSLSRHDQSPAALLDAAAMPAKKSAGDGGVLDSARLFPTSEQTLITYNRKHKDSQLTALSPEPAIPTLDYEWVTPWSMASAPQDLLNALHNQLTSSEGRTDLRRAGFRVEGEKAPSGSPLPSTVRPLEAPSSSDAVRTINSWRGLSKDARMLTLIDVSGSMSEKVSGKQTRIQLVSGLALQAIKTMPQSTELGVWAFSTDLRGPGKDWEQLTSKIHPIGPDDSANAFRGDVVSAIHELPKLVEKNGDTALYDSVWAAYKKASDTYDPTYVNSVVVLTDGKNEDPNGGLSLDQLQAKLKSAYDPDKPVKVVTIGVGDATDQDELREIAKAGHGQYYHPKTADEISQVFIDAFLKRN